MTTLLLFLFSFSPATHAEPATWIHCETPNKDFIFENGHVTLEGRLFFQNITDMKPLFESHSTFKKNRKEDFTIIFLPAQERFSDSPIGTLKEYFEDPIMNRFALHLDFSDFQKISEKAEDKEMGDGERDCRIKRKTTEFKTKAKYTRQNEVIRTQLKCIRTDEERFGGCS